MEKKELHVLAPQFAQARLQRQTRMLHREIKIGSIKKLEELATNLAREHQRRRLVFSSWHTDADFGRDSNLWVALQHRPQIALCDAEPIVRCGIEQRESCIDRCRKQAAPRALRADPHDA